MTILSTLRTEALALRKTKNPIASSIMFTISEIEKVGKNNGNRETTDDEAIRVIQKLIATIDENLKLNLTDKQKDGLTFERTILHSVLPQMASDEEIISFLKAEFPVTPPNKGPIMKGLKIKFGSLVDMKRASDLSTQLFDL